MRRINEKWMECYEMNRNVIRMNGMEYQFDWKIKKKEKIQHRGMKFDEVDQWIQWMLECNGKMIGMWKNKKNISMDNWTIPAQVNHCTAVMVEPTWRFLATGQWMAPSVVFPTDANKSTRDPVPFVPLNKLKANSC